MNQGELAAWLRQRETHYGGLHAGVPRRTVSKHDPRTAKQIARGGMQGGDRMNHHQYADDYAKALQYLETKFSGGVVRGLPLPTPSPHDMRPKPPRVHHGHRMQPKSTKLGRAYAGDYAGVVEDLGGHEQPLVVVELGILRGVGLAIWCDLFRSATVIGLDVDLSHFDENYPDLVKRGAFAEHVPAVYEFDELDPRCGENLSAILQGRTIDLMIDDALHYDAAILGALDTFMPHMSPGGVYVIEDNKTVHAEIRKLYPDLHITHNGELTVIRT